ncbi:MAG: hypothetical protein QOH93_1304 [Chloroflexia bacterium]|jgi:hypothetical protein|nr:hypothetical protein [Chloroflexia bacterium]
MGPLESESEFDHTLYTAEFVTAEPDEPLATILERVEDALTRTPNVVLILPRGSTAFHSTHDFLALGKLHSGRDVHVSIASPDPTIASLARVLGFYVESVPDGHDYYEEPGSVTEEDTEQPTSPLPLGPPRVSGPFPDKPEWVLSPSGYVYPVPSTTSTWLNHPSDPANAQEGIGANGKKPTHPHLSLPLSKSGVPPPRTRPRVTGQLQPTIITDPSLPSITGDRFDMPLALVSTTESGRIKARRTDEEAAAYLKLDGQETVRKIRRFTVRRVVTGVLVLLLLALVGAGTYAWIYLPEGSVEITPLKKDLVGLQIEVPVLITPGAAGQDGLATPLDQSSTGGVISTYSLTSTQLSATIVEQNTAPATGSRQVPKGRSRGTIIFTNSTPYPVTVPAGTTFTAANGVTVQVTQGGVVPATIFTPGATVSSLELEVEATLDGPAGNVAAKQLQSTYKGLTYINPNAIEGGTLETLKVVTQQDIDTLTADLNKKALDQGRALGLLLAQVPPGHELITQTMKFGEVSMTPSLSANQDGEGVSVVVTTSVQAFSYNKADVQKAVFDAIRDQVDMLPDTVGPVLDEGTIHYEPPAFQSIEAAQGRVTYSTSASARVNFTVTPTLKEQIRNLVTGKEIARARSLISERYGEYVNASDIKANVLWLTLDKLPSDSTRITIGEGTGAAYEPAPSSPSLRPDPSSQR